MRIRSFTILSLILLTLAAVGCGSSSDGDSLPETVFSTRISYLKADSGTLAPADAAASAVQGRAAEALGDVYTLTFEGVLPDVLWYTDRPEQDAGSTSLADYLAGWSDAYGDVAPNAVMEFYLQGDEFSGVYMMLEEPAYDEQAATLTFKATLLNSSFDIFPLGAIVLGDPILNVLNNSPGGLDVSSFIQYSGAAEVITGDDPDIYQVVLSDAADQMFWVDNAPGRYSDRSSVTDFFTDWDTIFADAPPNAAFYGTDASGATRIFFVTLTDPVYEDSLDMVTYQAQVLGNRPEGDLTIQDVVMSIDSTSKTSRLPMPAKGSCYAAFSKGYDPSSANNTVIYFGSDIGRKQMGSLWGTQSYLSESCGGDCRDDVTTMKSLGANLVRLYDWDPRNDHSQFLDYCLSKDMKVLATMSNYPAQHPESWDTDIPTFFTSRNYGNSSGSDWHSAVGGLLLTNEPVLAGIPLDNAIGLMARVFQQIDKQGWSKEVMVGIPTTFAAVGPPYASNGATMPAWQYMDQIVNDSRLAPYLDRIMLCVNSQNLADYIFNNAEATGKGYVELTYEQFGRPILFTELGRSRLTPGYTADQVTQQLSQSVTYQKAHPDQFLGVCHFQFSDKVWVMGTTEGSFGAYTHGAVVKTLTPQQSDFSYWPGPPAQGYGTLAIDTLVQTDNYQAVINGFK